jgi:hypothetical protein
MDFLRACLKQKSPERELEALDEICVIGARYPSPRPELIMIAMIILENAELNIARVWL